MGGSAARGFPSQLTTSLRGNQNQQKPLGIASGRRTMPDGPLLPRLPRNPYAVVARKIGTMSAPHQPNGLNPVFRVRGGQ